MKISTAIILYSLFVLNGAYANTIEGLCLMKEYALCKEISEVVPDFSVEQCVLKNIKEFPSYAQVDCMESFLKVKRGYDKISKEIWPKVAECVMNELSSGEPNFKDRYTKCYNVSY